MFLIFFSCFFIREISFQIRDVEVVVVYFFVVWISFLFLNSLMILMILKILTFLKILKTVKFWVEINDNFHTLTSRTFHSAITTWQYLQSVEKIKKMGISRYSQASKKNETQNTNKNFGQKKYAFSSSKNMRFSIFEITFIKCHFSLSHICRLFCRILQLPLVIGSFLGPGRWKIETNQIELFGGKIELFGGKPIKSNFSVEIKKCWVYTLVDRSALF